MAMRGVGVGGGVAVLVCVGLGVEAGASPVGQEVSVKGGVEETGEGVTVHQGVNLELGLLVHQVAGLGQGLVYSFSDPRVQAHLGQERNTDMTELSLKQPESDSIDSNLEGTKHFVASWWSSSIECRI